MTTNLKSNGARSVLIKPGLQVVLHFYITSREKNNAELKRSVLKTVQSGTAERGGWDAQRTLPHPSPHQQYHVSPSLK